MDGKILWTPPADARQTTKMGQLLSRVEERYEISLPDYDSFHDWSVENFENFYTELAEFCGLKFHDLPETTVTSRDVPGARWFPGGTLNYAEHVMDNLPEGVAITGVSEVRGTTDVTSEELREMVAGIRAGLVQLGVGRDDRVAGYLPNIPETIAAFLAVASLGAVWAVCPPEFGVRSVVDRLQQIEPKVFLAVDGYRFADKDFDRREHLEEVLGELKSVETVVWLPYLNTESEPIAGAVTWAEAFGQAGELSFEHVPFDHTLYVLFTSGTTALPKAVAHSHGGPLLEHHKWLGIHADLRAGDTFFWYSTTAWMVWNLAPAALTMGARVVTMDGSPTHGGLERLWQLVQDLGVTVLGASTGYVLACKDAGLRPGSMFDLSRLHSALVGGSPWSPDGWEWWYREVRDDILVGSPSGGTDVIGTYIGGSPLAPVRAGRQACVYLGVSAETRAPDGSVVVDTPGEIVVTTPIATMPSRLWNDEDGRRAQATYYDRWPGAYDQQDWTIFYEDGSCTVLGRSDATLNRGGVRLGPAEFYAITDQLPEIAEASIVHVQKASHKDGELCLFVVLNAGHELTPELRTKIAAEIRKNLSPRHVPDVIEAVPDLPKTLTGKRLEVPIRRILEGAAPETVASAGALANPAALDWFVERYAAVRTNA